MNSMARQCKYQYHKTYVPYIACPSCGQGGEDRKVVQLVKRRKSLDNAKLAMEDLAGICDEFFVSLKYWFLSLREYH